VQPDRPTPAEKLRPFTRRWRLMAFVVVAITALTYWHFASRPAEYAATTQIYVPSAGPAPIVGSDPETDPARRLLNEAAVLQSPPVAAQVARRLGYRGDPRDLLTRISVSPSTDSDFLGVSATTSSARRSANLANGFASAFVAMSMPRSRRPASGVRIISAATVPTRASGPSAVRDAVFAAVLGLVLAAILVAGLDAFDRRIRHPLVEAEYGLPLLASIPFSRQAHGAVLSSARMPVTVMERVRGLRTMLDHVAGPESPPRSLLVTSAIPGEGKSTLVKSLAFAYFESGKSVLVIDADLRQPALHQLFEAPLVPGLSEVLRSMIPLAQAVQDVAPGAIKPPIVTSVDGPREMVAVAPGAERRRARVGSGRAHTNGNAHDGAVMHLLTSGSDTLDPAALLSSAQLTALLTGAASRYELVLVDSPPVLAVSDAVPLAAAVDATLVVARSDFTTRDAAARCRQAFERMPDVTVLGVVANAVTDDPTHRYYTP
jgi:Mrp family chromosome partitioning ATPase